MAAKDTKGKGKATRDVPEESVGMSQLSLAALSADLVSPQDARLWVDRYAPQSLQDLAVHKRKVDDVRRWLEEAFSGKGRSKHRVGHSFCSPALEIYIG